VAAILDWARTVQDRRPAEGRPPGGYSPLRILWWEWGKLVGAVGLIVLGILLIVKQQPPAVVVAIILHFTIDFTFQTEETARRKVERGRHLVFHSLIAGGLPMIMAGIVAGDPVKALIWMAAGVVGHYLVDWTRRFGLRSVFWAVLADQVAHLAIIFGLVLLT